jgi:hypothetical protein
MTITIEWSNDGQLWCQSDPADQFTAITTNGNHVKEFSVKGAYMMVYWGISGTTPSFTTGITHATRGSRAFE